jgi:preprotein translocase subunit SecG|tara:strand:- start:55 stop:390 length:336 start_codon:yes stop_codon:yes gene_type:complete
MENLILTIHIIASLGVIGLVLVQHGKGADVGAAFGGGNSGSAFGVAGAANFLSRATSVCVTTFFCTSIALAVVATNNNRGVSVVNIPQATSESLVTESESDENMGTQDIPN